MADKLEWNKPQRWYVASACGRYTISKSFVDKQVSYTAWRLSPDTRKAPHTILGVTATYEEAKAVAEQDNQTEKK